MPTPWDKAARQAEREMPFATMEEKAERAEEIYQELLADAAALAEEHPLSPQVQHPAGQMLLDHRAAARRMMKDAGVDPDAPLNINWNHIPDIRDNRDPADVWAWERRVREMEQYTNSQ